MRRPPSGSGYILLPQLSGVIGLLVVLRFIWTFNEFDDIYLLTGGGAGTEVVSVRIFNQLTGRGDIGAAAALSLMLAGAAVRPAVRVLPLRTSRGESMPMSGSGTAPLSREVVETRILARAAEVGRRRLLRRRDHRSRSLHGPCSRCGRSTTSRADPGALSPARFVTFATYGEVLRSVEQGGQGFLVFLRNSAIIATVGGGRRRCWWRSRGAYASRRLEFFGRRQVSALFLAVYLFPAILLGDPTVRALHALGLRGSLIGLI